MSAATTAKKVNPKKYSPVKEKSSTLKKCAQSLEKDFAAISLSFSWFGEQKKLTDEESEQTADLFDADPKAVTAKKKLLDRKYPYYKACLQIRNKMYQFWKSSSLPYPESGIRLVPRVKIDDLIKFLNESKQELEGAVAELNAHKAEFLSHNKALLGKLYDEMLYPKTFIGCFGVHWDFHNVNPPDYLMQLNPKLYEEQKARMMAKFEEAVQLAEAAFFDQFQKLLKNLTHCLAPSVDGERKIFKDSTLLNLTDFCDKFKEFNVRSNPDLDKLINDAKGILKGVKPDTLRKDMDFRAEVQGGMEDVQKRLESLMTAAPRRKLVRD